MEQQKPKIADYTIKGGIFGLMQKVSFNCPDCASPLLSPLEEAGKVFPCPVCASNLCTPGEKELNKQIEEAEMRKAEKARAKAEKAGAKAKEELQVEKAVNIEPTEEPTVEKARGSHKPDSPKSKGGLSLVGLIGLAVICWWVKSSLFPSTVPDIPVSSLTFADFDSKFSTDSQATDGQKDQMIAHYKGTRVRWQGILENVDGDMADFQEKATTLTHDVALEVADDERPKLLGLNKGDLVTYEGTIVDYGSILAHRLKDGRIVDSKHMSPDEKVIWLANSQTAALKPIADNMDAK